MALPNPLDFDGPTFISFYLALMVLTVLAVVTILKVRGPRGDPPGFASLAPYEVAYLAGGELEVADAAVAALVHSGVLGSNAVKRAVFHVLPMPADIHPVERAAYASIPRNASGAVDSVRAKVRRQAHVLRGNLVREKLVVGDARRAFIRGAPILLAFGLLVLGIAKILVGIAQDRPVGYLLILTFVVFVILAGVGWYLVRLPYQPLRTGWGNRALARIQDANAALEYGAKHSHDVLARADLVLAVSLFGLGVVQGGKMRWINVPPTTAASGSGCAAFAGGGCGGASCGGGCGGGGCGGCGG